MADDRIQQLEAKAKSEGLTDDEADELGRLYAEKAGEPYANADSAKASGEAAEQEESEERRDVEAGQRAEQEQEADRAQAMPPGEAREPDYD